MGEDARNSHRDSAALLLTDIVGSTLLWEQRRALMADVYATHDAILRRSIGMHAGTIEVVTGDAFQIRFPSVRQAIEAAYLCQQELSSLPELDIIRVRMVIQAIPASINEQERAYARANSLLLATHGGQILLSDSYATAALPLGVGFLALGAHRLRDLQAPRPIFQLTGPGIPDSFPPIPTLALENSNLPMQPNPLIGRHALRQELRQLLCSHDRHLVTLTGPGGIGKTRLAMQLAADLIDHFSDGVFCCELALVHDPDLFLSNLAIALGLQDEGDAVPEEHLKTFLRHRNMLILLDNLEQLIPHGVAHLITSLLSSAPGLTLLVTSRESLNIHHEHRLSVSPLSLPAFGLTIVPEQIAMSESVELFVQRARAVRDQFEITADNALIIAEICHALDGIPLAIELAAARLATRSPETLLARLSDQLSVLVRGSRDLPDRHQTIQATIAWSFDLLPPAEQHLFLIAALFPGGCTPTSIAAIGHDRESVTRGLASLAGKSLLRCDASTERYSMLTTIREFAIRAFDATPHATDHRQRWLQWALHLESPLDPENLQPWIEAIRTDQDNLIAAMEWSRTHGEGEIALRLIEPLAQFWRRTGRFSVGIVQTETTLSIVPDLPSIPRVSALRSAGVLSFCRSDYTRARTWYEQGEHLAELIGDETNLAGIHSGLAGIAVEQGELDVAERRYTEALRIARIQGDRQQQASTLGNLGAVAHYRGASEEAQHYYDMSLTIWRALNDTFGISFALSNLLSLLVPDASAYAKVQELAHEACSLSKGIDDRQGTAYIMNALGAAALIANDLPAAESALQEACAYFQEVRDSSGIARAQGNLGLVALKRGELTIAADFCRTSLSTSVELGERDTIAYSFENLAVIATASEQHVDAVHMLGIASKIRSETGTTIPDERVDDHEHAVRTLKHHMGNAAFAAHYGRGQMLTIESILQLALNFPIPEMPQEALIASFADTSSGRHL